MPAERRRRSARKHTGTDAATAAAAASPRQTQAPPRSTGPVESAGQTFEVGQILDSRAAKKRGGGGEEHGKEYLVSWAGYPPSENSWEPQASLLSSAREALEEFEAAAAAPPSFATLRVVQQRRGTADTVALVDPRETTSRQR